MEKVNLQDFKLASLLAKLLIIQLKYINVKSELLQDKPAFHQFIENQVLASFTYAETEFERIKAHLSLFLLNNEDNSFSRLIKL